MGKLTKKQELFVKEYLIDLNATQAAIRAGYSKKTAQQISTENLSKPVIADAIKKAMDERIEKLDTSADQVIKDLAMLRDMCLGRVAVTRTIMLKVGDGDMMPVETTGKVFEPAGAKGALELLGKHHKLFTEKMELSGEISLAEAIAKARARVQ